MVAVTGVSKLHIGGTEKKDGWHIFNIEPGDHVDVVGDCCDLSMFHEESLGEIYASHVIEHISHNEKLLEFFSEANRVLKSGGKIYIAVPDFEALVNIYFHKHTPVNAKRGVINMLFGAQDSEHNIHRCAFDYELISYYLGIFGFSDIRRVDSFGIFNDCSTNEYGGVRVSLNVEAVKKAAVAVQSPSREASVPTSSANVLYGPQFNVPQSMLSAFTMNGLVPITLQFLAETSGGELHWTRELWEHRKLVAANVIREEVQYVYDSDPFLVKMLKAHPIAGSRCLVIGSIHPFYEAMVDEFGGIPSTVEYRKIHHDIPGLRTYTVPELEAASATFDSAISISSIEHDGLGRYGDPIDPDGDLKAMRRCKSYIKPGGLLFLAVPVGRDAVCWNVHRIYGRARLPRLLEGWEIVDSSGFAPELFDRGQLGVDFVQPVFVLKNI